MAAALPDFVIQLQEGQVIAEAAGLGAHQCPVVRPAEHGPVLHGRERH